MGITKYVLKKPVTTVMAILCLIVFGLSSVFSSKLELTPEMSVPMLIVSTVYPGASPDDVNDLVTTEIEDEIGSLSGIKEIQSTAMENASITIIQYEYGTDIDEAYDDLKKKIDVVTENLPDDCDDPLIYELNLDDMASISLAVNHSSTSNLYNYVDNEIVPELEKISSVSSVDMSGGQKQYIQIEVIPEKLSQYKLDISTLASTVGAADFSYPVGDVKMGRQSLSVSAGTEYDTLELIRQIPVTTSSGKTIRLEDVANVQNNLEEATSIAHYNGEDTISLEVKKQQSASAVDVSKSVRKVIDQLQNDDPDLQIRVVNDTSDNIKSSLSNVAETMVLAVVVSMIIIFLFFGEIRASLIVGTSIPISILAALVCMSAMGFSLNMITMSSLVLGVGMMVDNSIVVLESCFRNLKGNGVLDYHNAALDGTDTVVSSVMGSTITTCVVFLPLALLTGMTGQLFKPLGFTIVFCMTGSFLSAISLVPLCFATYRPREKGNSPAGGIIRGMQKMYRSFLPTLLKHKGMVVLTSIGLLVASFAMASQLKTDLIPSIDEGMITVSIESRPGLSIEDQTTVLQSIESYVMNDSEVESCLLTSGGSGISLSGSSASTLTAYLKDDRHKDTDEVIRLWKKELPDFKDVNITVESASSMSVDMGDDTKDIEYILQSAQYDELKSASDKIAAELTARPEVNKIHTTLENAAPVVKLRIDTMKANAEGVSPIQIAMNLNYRLDGIEATTLNVNGQDVDVNVEYAKTEYDTIEKLEGILLPTNTGGTVALTDVAEIAFEDSPVSITRKDKQYQVTITGMFTDAADKDTEQKLYDEVISKYLEGGITRGLNSTDTSMGEEFAALGIAIATAVFLIFVVMSAQFESAKYSVMVMTTIPFALIGSFGLLYVTDVTISITTLLGFLMLVGTVVNNGILYVDTVNQLKLERSLEEAVVEAGAIRLRPILMTTLTTIVSMIPMALAYGDSGELMQGLALVDVGGLIASTILALLLLPVYYLLMDRSKTHMETLDVD